MATLEAIQKKIKNLQAQAEAIVARQSSEVVEKIRDLMAQHGLTIADIEAGIGAPKTGAKRGPKPGFKRAGKTAGAAAMKKASFQTKGELPAKYLNPKTGATWTGRGRAPAWIAEAKDRSRFLIAAGTEVTVAATGGTANKAKTAVKKTSAVAGATAHKGQPKGPQPALYRDPKSGATWSGRGRAPAWLASAKDRSKFLIDNTSAAAADSVANKTKQATKKAAPVAKKAAAKTVKAAKVPAAKKAAAKNEVGAKVAAPKGAASKKAAGKRAAPTAKKTAAKKAPATKAVVASDVVAKADVAAAPEGLAAQATA